MKKDVLMINYTGRKGGGPLDAYQITKALIDAGIPVVAVLSNQIENLKMWEKLNLEKLVLIPTYNSKLGFVLNSILFPLKQKNHIKKSLGKYNIKYIFCPMGTFWSRKINKIFNNSVSGIVIHDPILHSGENSLINRIANNAYKSYDFLFVHSKQFLEYVEKKYKRPTYYMSLGNHDIYRYVDKKETIIEYDTSKTNYFFFGRISKYKGLDILAKAYKRVFDELQGEVSLTIIGSGDFSPYLDTYKDLQNVKIINRWIKDEETESVFIGNNIICICPYTDATQSGVIPLAMDYQVPLIATETGGIAEQVINDITGLLVPPSDVDALAMAMIRLAKDDELRQFMRENQKNHMSKMGWDISVQQLISAMNISF